MNLIWLGELINENKQLIERAHFVAEELTSEQKKDGIEIDTIPFAEHIEGKTSILFYNPVNHEVFYEYFDIPLSLEKQVGILNEKNKTANQRYEEMSKDSNLVDLKNSKIFQLKELCTEAIYSGFTSVNDYKFGFNEKDQLNFNGQLNKINLWYNQVTKGQLTQEQFDAKFPLSWKSVSNGVVQLTVDEFIKVTNDGEAHLMLNQIKYWQKEAQVKAATDNAQVDAIVW